MKAFKLTQLAGSEVISCCFFNNYNDLQSVLKFMLEWAPEYEYVIKVGKEKSDE